MSLTAGDLLRQIHGNGCGPNATEAEKLICNANNTSLIGSTLKEGLNFSSPVSTKIKKDVKIIKSRITNIQKKIKNIKTTTKPSTLKNQVTELLVQKKQVERELVDIQKDINKLNNKRQILDIVKYVEKVIPQIEVDSVINKLRFDKASGIFLLRVTQFSDTALEKNFDSIIEQLLIELRRCLDYLNKVTVALDRIEGLFSRPSATNPAALKGYFADVLFSLFKACWNNEKRRPLDAEMNYSDTINIAREPAGIIRRRNGQSADVSAEQYYIDLVTAIIGVPPSNSVISKRAINVRVNRGQTVLDKTGIALNELLFTDILKKPKNYKQGKANPQILKQLTGENRNSAVRAYAKYMNILQNSHTTPASKRHQYTTPGRKSVRHKYLTGNKRKAKFKVFRIVDFLVNYTRLLRIEDWEKKIDKLISRKRSPLYKLAQITHSASVTEDMFRNMTNNNSRKWIKN